MVVFTCFHCGDSVKKPSVAKHYQTKCKKNEPSLTCVDCLKDFQGTAYEAHTKCLTEDEKYSAKGYVPKPSQNKGERKQQAWQESIQIVLKKPSLKPDERELISKISKYENVPRKKNKFINFLANAFKQFANNSELIDRVWIEMETVFKENAANTNENQNQEKQAKEPKKQETENNTNTLSSPKENNAVKKEKKRKRQAEEEKPADSSETGKTDEKLKKKKQKSNEENLVEGNTDMLITDEPESNQGINSRKRKADENGQFEQNDSVADEAEPGKKKKKKKHEKPAVNQNPETPTENPEGETKSKKKNKKAKGENADSKQTENAEAPSEAGDSNAVKKEKKNKKSENKENCGEKPVESKEDSEKPASKKKKPKAEAGGDEDKPESFDWKATILQVLNQDGKNNKIQLQKLQKKVLKLHCQILNCETSEKKEKKFLKKLKEMPQIEIDQDFVVLKS